MSKINSSACLNFILKHVLKYHHCIYIIRNAVNIDTCMGSVSEVEAMESLPMFTNVNPPLWNVVTGVRPIVTRSFVQHTQVGM